jgi:hypothetical protein
MTLIHLFIWFIWFSFGIGGGFFGWHYFGILGAIIGFPLGLVAFLLIIYTFGNIINVWDKWNPRFPPCQKGKCQASDDYKTVGYVKGWPVYECKCGDFYYYYPWRFLEIIPDGKLRSYLRNSHVKSWHIDDKEPPFQNQQLFLKLLTFLGKSKL